jgi:hypothetical protein
MRRKTSEGINSLAIKPYEKEKSGEKITPTQLATLSEQYPDNYKNQNCPQTATS